MLLKKLISTTTEVREELFIQHSLPYFVESFRTNEACPSFVAGTLEFPMILQSSGLLGIAKPECYGLLIATPTTTSLLTSMCPSSLDISPKIMISTTHQMKC